MVDGAGWKSSRHNLHSSLHFPSCSALTESQRVLRKALEITTDLFHEIALLFQEFFRSRTHPLGPDYMALQKLSSTEAELNKS